MLNFILFRYTITMSLFRLNRLNSSSNTSILTVDTTPNAIVDLIAMTKPRPNDIYSQIEETSNDLKKSCLIHLFLSFLVNLNYEIQNTLRNV